LNVPPKEPAVAEGFGVAGAVRWAPRRWPGPCRRTC